MKLKCSLITLLLPLVVSANNKVGNGGDGIFCTNAGKMTGTLLDFYEASATPTAKGKSAAEIAENQLAKLKETAPKLYTQYSGRLKTIESEIDFRSNITLTDIPDSEHLFTSSNKNCELLQIAIRKPETQKDEKLFLVRKDLWDSLDQTQQAGLLVHEIVYEHYMKLGEKNSIKARKFNRFLFEKDFNRDQLWKFLAELRVPIYP